MTDNVTPIKPNEDAAKPKASETAEAEKKASTVSVSAPQNPSQNAEIAELRKKAKAAEDKVKELNKKLAKPQIAPLARPARMKSRHWGVLASFVLSVITPLAAVILYLMIVAGDQYISKAGFTVRSQDGASATDLLGGLAQFTGAGGATASDTAILYEYIHSQEMVEAVDRELDILGHYSREWPRDWVFAIWPSATIEDLTWFWQRIVSVSYDSSTGLIEVQVTAFDPETAQAISKAIVANSQMRVNSLNEQARDDAMRYARTDLDEALEQLKAAREAMVQFRTRTRIVDPEADIQGRMGVMNNLQQQLAEALVEFDLLSGSVGVNDPRLRNAERLIGVIRTRIDQERTSFIAEEIAETGNGGESYPALISEYERLSVDRVFAEEMYRVAQTSFELARDEAARQSRYLATYINPTKAESSEYPNRWIVSAIAGIVLLMGWSIIVLVYYSVRDRR
ncbi:sugar transporter [Shimia sp. R9_1]|uniref:sugar transporter n=1 Tax=unclassified Shimia TaxID=2630038 RepID=UPI001ADAB8FF|nr:MULTISPECIES: sugar transporter [unclassified Shimia]MBO9395304.1 sugar transporter [Shimia sp. R9_2]MBO9407309.1 sugar transporter [Shimia sp. R9_1]